jgi:RimJ/RimL family protein N-acetyltransferase
VALRPALDGTLLIRSIRPDDLDRLQAHHERLSPESRYRRFLVAKPVLTNADARYLVDVDGCDHHALVATLCEDGGEAIVGVARYIRSPENRTVAEVAIVVADAHQHHGVGGELLARLAEAAVGRGVLRFQATMLADNLAVHRLFESIAVGPVARRRLGGLSEMEFGLPGAEHAGADCGTPVAA